MKIESTQVPHQQTDRASIDVTTRNTRDANEASFQDLWAKLRYMLGESAVPEITKLFESIQRRFPGRFQESQLVAMQQAISAWKAVEVTPAPCRFEQAHVPAWLGTSDFYTMAGLKIRVAGQRFDHKFYHFILPFSRWETGTVFLSETFENFSQGLQNALWELGGVPQMHCVDRRTSAVNSEGDGSTFRRRYRALLAHYGLTPLWFNGSYWHGNQVAGILENSFKQALNAALVLRGNRNFLDRAAYEQFLSEFLHLRNLSRTELLIAERSRLADLPARRVDTGRRSRVRVTKGSAIRVQTNTYSVPSRLIGAIVDVHVTSDSVEVRHRGELVETLPRLRGQHKCSINYHHVLDWLASKPTAFARYPYRDAMFPTSRFRQAYETLVFRFPPTAGEHYLRILRLTADGKLALVDAALGQLLDWGAPIITSFVEEQLRHEMRMRRVMGSTRRYPESS
jgi:hypothetical protein